MRFLVLLLVVLISGCDEGIEHSSDNHGFGFDVDATDEKTGITLTHYEHSNPPYEIDIIVDIYHATESCLGLYSAIGPPVIMTGNTDNLVSETFNVNVNGQFHFYPSLVVVFSHRTSLQVERTLRHEFIHYLLFINGISTQHEPSNQGLFDSCAPTP